MSDLSRSIVARCEQERVGSADTSRCHAERNVQLIAGFLKYGLNDTSHLIRFGCLRSGGFDQDE